MEKKLDFGSVLSQGFLVGMKNLPSLLGAIVLWLLTIWIPYVNVGTTIAIMTIPIKFSKGEIFSPLCIFEKQYYRYMGEFFLTCGWYTAGVLMAMVFLVVPGIVLGIIWSQALYLVLDKGVNPAKALSLSNKMTYGNKWIIFAVMFIVYIAFLLASMLLTWIPFIGVIIAFCLMVIYVAMILGCSGMMYGKLLENLTEEDFK